MRAVLIYTVPLARLANRCADNAAIYAVVWRREEVHDNASSQQTVNQQPFLGTATGRSL